MSGMVFTVKFGSETERVLIPIETILKDSSLKDKK
jgi:hypothetical protein